MHLKAIMSTPALTCRPSDPLDAAARLMWNHDIGVVPVVSNKGQLVGMLTDRDICMAAYMQGISLHDITVSSAMSKRVFTCHADDSLEDAERMMREKQVRRIPVVDGEDRPIGIISFNDVARYAASTGEEMGLDRGLTETLAAICQPRPRARVRQWH